MLTIEKLTKQYGDLTAVDDVDLTIKRGTLFGLLGPNGAGKSTTISMISTLLKPTKGYILFNNEDIVKNPKAIQPHMGIVPQEIALYTTLTGMDNMIFWGKAYGLKGSWLKKRIAEVADIIGIDDRLKDKVDQYSGGMKRRLNIGVALLHQPELLIMDEPTVGIDPQSRNHILETVKALNRMGTTIIYTSHYMEEVETLCDEIAIMDHGKIIAYGTKEALLSRVSEKSIITVQFSCLDDVIVQKIMAINSIEKPIFKENVLTFYADQSTAVGIVFNVVKDTHSDIVSVDVKQPNLETVFLALTGKALRD